MKIRNMLLLLFFGILLTSCLNEASHPVYEDFLCSVNTDGTGFTQVCRFNELPFEPSDVSDLNATRDGKLIFSSRQYYITDPDIIAPIPLSDLSYSGNLTISNDDKLYYCNNGDLYQYDLYSQVQTDLTENYDGFLSNPIISNDNSIITMVKVTQDSTHASSLCYYRITDSSLHILPEAGTFIQRGIYNHLNHIIYYEQGNGLYRINLDGTQNTQLLTYNSLAFQSFGLSVNNDNLVTLDDSGVFSLFNITGESITYNIQLSLPLMKVKLAMNSNLVFYVWNGYIYSYNIDHQTTFKIPNTAGVNLIMCPNWDGTKVYFKAPVRIN